MKQNVGEGIMQLKQDRVATIIMMLIWIMLLKEASSMHPMGIDKCIVCNTKTKFV